MTRLYIEKYWPLSLSIVITYILIQFYERFENSKELINGISSVSLTIATTLLGFLLAILAMLNGINTRRMRFVRESGAYNRVISYLKLGLISSIVVLSFNLLEPFYYNLEFSDLTKPHLYKAYNIIFAFFIFWCWLTNIRFFYLFILILADPEKK